MLSKLPPRVCWKGGGGGQHAGLLNKGGGSNRLPGLVTKQQAMEFPQVQTIVHNNYTNCEYRRSPSRGVVSFPSSADLCLRQQTIKKIQSLNNLLAILCTILPICRKKNTAKQHKNKAFITILYKRCRTFLQLYIQPALFI